MRNADGKLPTVGDVRSAFQVWEAKARVKRPLLMAEAVNGFRSVPVVHRSTVHDPYAAQVAVSEGKGFLIPSDEMGRSPKGNVAESIRLYLKQHAPWIDTSSVGFFTTD